MSRTDRDLAGPAPEGFRLSPQQRRLWALGLGAERARVTAVLDGPLDRDRLARALREVVRRHEVLRTRFESVPGLTEPMQVVDVEEPELETGGATSPAAGDGRSTVRARLTAEGEEQHLLELELPALCADEAALADLVRQLAERYAAEDGPEDEAPLQYIDFAEWQNEVLEGEDSAEVWRDLDLAGFEDWRLPFEQRPERSPDPPPRLRRVEVSLADGVAERVEALAAAAGATAEAVFLASWQLLLARLSDRDRVVVAAASDGRELEDLRGALGVFCRYLPVAAAVAGGSSRELVRAAAEALREARERQESFAWSHGSGPEGVPAERGVPYGFRYREEARVPDAAELRVAIAARSSRVERCGCELVVERCGHRLDARLEVDPERFPRAEAIRLAGLHETLLQAVLDTPERPARALDLVSGALRSALLAELNDTAVESRPEGGQAHRRIARQAVLRADAPALVHGAAWISFGALESAANRLAHHLRRRGAGPGAVVALALERSPDLVVALLAVLKSGAAYLPLDPAQPPRRLQAILASSGAVLLVARGGPPPGLGQPPAVLDLDRERAAIAACPDRDPRVETAGDELAYVLFTSGSTGRPKGVLVTRDGLANYLAWAARTYPLGGGRGTPVHTSIGFDLTVTSLLLPLSVGATVLLIPEARGIDGLAELLDRGGLDLVKLTPAHLDALRELVRKPGRAGWAGALVVGGEALRGEHLTFWRERDPALRVFNEYGPTETVVGSAAFELPTGPVAPGAVAIGRPIDNTSLYVFDRHGTPAPPWCPGELHVGGAGLARGYAGQPATTAERFVPHPIGRPGERLYRTGDLVRHLPSGALEYLGRTDHQLKVRGHRVEPAEIEAALFAHPEVDRCAVVLAPAVSAERAAEDGDAAAVLTAYVAPPAGAPAPAVESLRRFLEARLPSYMVPALYVALPALPVSANGKVDRAALPAPEEARRAAGPAYEAPATSAEETLAEIWAAVLGLERVGVEDNFFTLGGDSIRSIRVRSEAEKRGLYFDVQQMLEHPTVRGLARLARHGADPDAGEGPPPSFSLVREEDAARLPDGVEDAFPLTSLQAGMLFHSGFSDEARLFHEVASFRLRGELDEGALDEALRALVRRHPALRTSFELSEFSEPLQLVHRAAELTAVSEDLSALPPAEQDEVIARLLGEEEARPFDWRRPPLLRVRTHRRGPELFQFTVTVHHALLDGWSTASLLTELFRCYRGLLEGRPGAGAAPATPSPAALVAAERRALASAESREFWRSRLRSASRTPLPRWPRLDAAPVPGGESPVVLVPLRDLGPGLGTVARAAGVPLKSVLLAVHLRVLGLATRSPRPVTGLITETRLEEPGGDEIAGLFLNTTPIGIELSTASAQELARRAHAAERELFAHRRYPLAEMRRLAHGDLPFDTAFNFTHFHVYEGIAEAGGLEVLGGLAAGRGNFPLAANFSATRDAAVQLALEYDPAELPRAQVEALAALYRRSAETFAAGEGTDGHSWWLGSDERQALARSWSGGPPAAPAEPVHRTVGRRAAEVPDRVAVVLGDRQVTYGELDARGRRLAATLRALGVGPGAVAGVCLGRTPAALVAMLAVLKSGGAYLPLDPEYPRERLELLVTDSGVRLVVGSETALARLPDRGLRRVAVDPRGEPVQAADPAAGAAPAPSPEEAAYVIYTSGSTGRPKGVVAVHRGLANFCEALADRIALASEDRMLQFASFSFDASALQIFPTLSRGATIVMHPDPAGLSAQQLLDLCRRHRVTILDLPGALWRQWTAEMASGRTRLPASVRAYLTGGERLRTESLERWADLVDPGALFLSSYGPTEATVTTTVLTGTRDDLFGGNLVEGAIGRPLAGVGLRLLDERLDPVPAGVAGELYIAGAGLARGYLGRPGLTAERFVPDPFCGMDGVAPGGRAYRTGDLARWLPRGDVEFLGRTDDQVKVRGFRVEPGEVEAALGRHPEVREAAVVVREEEGGERRLVAYVVPRDGGGATGDPRAHLLETLPRHMVPSGFVRLAALPLLPSGKVDRQALLALAEAPHGDREHVAPRSAMERRLAAIWAGVLPVEEVGVFDNFFELGGDSILSIQIVSRAHREGLRLTPRDLFEHQTVAELARVVAEGPARADGGGDEPVIGPVPLTPIQRWFFSERFEDPHHFNHGAWLEADDGFDARGLATALAAVIEHHDALRLRFEPGPDGWRQECVPPAPGAPFAVADLRALPTSRRSEARAEAAERLQRGFDLGRAPLTRMVLFSAENPPEDRLLWLAHHLVLDGVAWRILLEDLELAYRQALDGREPALPPKTTSFKSWAERLAAHARSGALEAESRHWLAVAGEPVPAIPLDHPEGRRDDRVGTVRWVGFTLAAEETAGLLREVAGPYRAQLHEVLLAVLVRVVTAWAGTRRLVVDLEGHGREPVFDDLDVSRTVGWFTTQYPIVLELGADGSLATTLAAVKESLRRVPGGGMGYGLLRFGGAATETARALAAAPGAPVSFNYLGQFPGGGPSGEAPGPRVRLAAGPLGAERSPRAHRTHRLEVNAFVAGGRLRVAFGFSGSIHRRATVEKLSERTAQELKDLAAGRDEEEAARALAPSDFPLAELEEETFRRLATLLEDAG